MSEESERPKVLESVRNSTFTASPYLQTRVLAVLKERQEKGRKLRFWRFAALGSAAFSAVLALSIFLVTPRAFHATVGAPFAIRVALEDLPGEQVAEVEMELPEHVHFFSKKHPELASERRLRIADHFQSSGGLPFIVSSDAEGKQTIKVRFFGLDHALIAEKTIGVEITRSL